MEEKLSKCPLFLVELCLLNYALLEFPLENSDLLGAMGIDKGFGRAGAALLLCPRFSVCLWNAFTPPPGNDQGCNSQSWTGFVFWHL